jgi:hypothetical protein
MTQAVSSPPLSVRASPHELAARPHEAGLISGTSSGTATNRRNTSAGPAERGQVTAGPGPVIDVRLTTTDEEQERPCVS